MLYCSDAQKQTIDVQWHLWQNLTFPLAFQWQENKSMLPPLPSHITPLLLHLLVPPALVKANILETSPEHSQCLRACLRIAKVRVLVSLQERELNVCQQAGWVYYSAAWQKRSG